MFKSVRVMGRFARGTGSALVLSLRPLGRLGFHFFLVNVYKAYLVVKKPVVEAWRPAKNRVLFPLSTRYVVHAMLILATFFVATNSLKARELREEDFNSPALLTALLNREDDEEIVETADTIGTTRNQHFYSGIGGISPSEVSGGYDVLTEEDVAATQDTSSLIKPSFTSTDEAARPREAAFRYTVEEGDTVSTIAQKFHVSINTILYENRLGANDYIRPGQQMTVLPMTGVSHQIQARDTIASIAQKYSVSQEEILSFNKLVNADQISQGQILIIPNGTPPAPQPLTPTTRLAERPSYNTGFGTPPPNAPTQGVSGLLWPTRSHKINQAFRGRYHTGADIDGNFGDGIYAARAGRVIFAGWGRGYGLHVVVDHGGGVQTLYGHASKVYVKPGQDVGQGQAIAAQGSTGRSTGVHLHFEVRRYGVPYNPLSYF